MTDLYDGVTSLLVVDVQNDFADPAGSLYVAGAEEISARHGIAGGGGVGSGARRRPVPDVTQRRQGGR